MCGLSIVLFGATFHAAAATQFPFLSPTKNWKYNDESVDLGTAWIAPAYNDSAWSNGVVAIGFAGLNSPNEALPAPNAIHTIPRKNTPTNAARDILTYYFRAHFTLTNSPRGMLLVASNLIDDGAVFYLNGREVGRVAMPDGGVTWDTLATRNDDIGTSRTPTINTHGYDVFDFPIDALVQGDNVMAVEVHQANSGSSDMVFQSELWAVFLDPTFLSITNQPTDLMLEEGKPLKLQVGVSGDGASYQWYYKQTPAAAATAIPGAFGDTYFIQTASTNDSGIYFVIASNAINSVTSRSNTVNVVIDLSGPMIIDANGSISDTNVLVTFLDPVTAATANVASNYKVTNTLGGTLTVSSAVLSDGTNVLLTTTAPRMGNNNYLLVVNGLRDTSLRNNLITPNSLYPISNLATNLIGFDSDGWRYYDPYAPFDVEDLGTAWKETVYDEGANNWSDGVSAFFNAGSGGTTFPVPVNTILSQTPGLITYFRKPISGFQFSPGNQQFRLSYAIDDGAIFYMNGTEVLRVNMPAGPVTYTTRASATVGSAVKTGPISVTAPINSSGNLLAVELHQVANNDVDKGFAMQLDAYVRSVAVGPAIIAGGPFDVTAQEGQPATFDVIQVGGASFQWQKNNVDINGANGESYTIPAVSFADNNASFHVTVTGANGSVTSTNARLHVITDNVPPTLVSAYANGNSIVVTFSESMNAGSVMTVGNYMVTNSAGQPFPVTSASLANGTDVTLSFASLPAAQYFVVVNNVRDASSSGNKIANDSAVKVGFNATVIDFDSIWRYDQRAINLSAAGWTARTYNDSAWTGSGPGLLDGKAGGRNPATLPLPVGTVINPPANNGGTYLTTTYFRTHFNSYGAGDGMITFSTVLDDGAVYYLNGTEITRTRMPAGAVTFSTQANGAAVGDASLESIGTFAVSNLLSGDNVIAVEVHQNGTASSDVTWGGQFSVVTPSMPLAPYIPGPACTNIAVTTPLLHFQRAANGTNVVLSWTNPVTNSCGSNAVFTLQQTLQLANPGPSTVWTTVTTTSPYTAVATNKTRYFRLKL